MASKSHSPFVMRLQVSETKSNRQKDRKIVTHSRTHSVLPPDDNHMKWIFLDYDNSKQLDWITFCERSKNAGQTTMTIYTHITYSMHSHMKSSLKLSRVSCDISFEHIESVFFFFFFSFIFIRPFPGMQSIKK